MKSFSQFLTETSASQQAARLGLEGDGHGGWYDRSTGEFTAKTVKVLKIQHNLIKKRIFRHQIHRLHLKDNRDRHNLQDKKNLLVLLLI